MQPLLTSDDNKLNHFYRLAKKSVDENSKESGTLVVYDSRTFDVSVKLKDKYQIDPVSGAMGAKIADGVLDDVVNMQKELFVRDLVIQHTDKQNMNIHIQIPQMTLDHIFADGLSSQYEKTKIKNYKVTSAADRKLLLGTADKTERNNITGTKDKNKEQLQLEYDEEHKGILDKGMDYLLSAITLVGAQASRLDFTEDNVDTQLENEQSAESNTRDLDIAKEYTTYLKYNILEQASQSMLAQANQNLSGVLSLLQ